MTTATYCFGRNKKLGVVGYGDIGQACARMARVFGMHILALRRRTDLSESERDSGLKVIPAHSLTYTPSPLLQPCFITVESPQSMTRGSMTRGSMTRGK